jgi:uncharacterized protein YdeI (BOF family)
MKTTLILAAVLSLAVGPALADKVEKAEGGSITAAGKEYKLSGSRTKVTIKGAAGTRDDVKVGMDCAITGPAGGEASVVDCK